MPIKLIQQSTVVEAAGNIPKQIEEFIGVVNSETTALSIANMTSPAGWQEPGRAQRLQTMKRPSARPG